MGTQLRSAARPGPVPLKQSRTRIESSETVVILSLAIPPRHCTQRADRGLARERESRGRPLGGSCATSTRTGPSDTDGRSPESETLEREETEPWALSCRASCLQNKLISPYRTSGLWGLIGAHSSSRSAYSTATVAW